jgi:hypothetical protein
MRAIPTGRLEWNTRGMMRLFTEIILRFVHDFYSYVIHVQPNTIDT